MSPQLSAVALLSGVMGGVVSQLHARQGCEEEEEEGFHSLCVREDRTPTKKKQQLLEDEEGGRRRWRTEVVTGGEGGGGGGRGGAGTESLRFVVSRCQRFVLSLVQLERQQVEA